MAITILLAIIFFLSAIFCTITAFIFAIKKKETWKRYFIGMFSCFILFFVFVIMAPTESTNSKNNAQLPLSDKKEIKTEAFLEKTTPIPHIKEYLKEYEPIMDEIEKEFIQIKKSKGPTKNIRNHHFDFLQNKIDELEKYDIFYYPNHEELKSYILYAHGYNISLWQSYQDNNIKQINDFTKLVSENITKFKKMSAKIKSGSIKDKYTGPNKALYKE